MNSIATSTISLLAITPLLISPFTAEVFELPKTLFLYLMTGIILILSKNLPEIKKAHYFYILILFTTLLSTIFSMDWYTSIFGYYTRFNGGLLSILCYTLLSMFLYKVLPKYRDVITNYIIASTLLISIYGIFQHFGIDKNMWKANPTERIFSTFGQPNWLAAYLVATFFLSLKMGIEKFKTKTLIALLIPTIIYTAILYTYSISGLVSLILGIFILAIIGRNIIIENRKFILTLIVILTALSIIIGRPYLHRLNKIKEAITQNINPIKVYALETLPDSIKVEDTGNIRLILWKGTISLATSSYKNILIGTGPQTFVYAFPLFRPQEINNTSEARTIHNKPHNWYLELLSDLGLLGFISYIIFIVMVIKKHKNDYLSLLYFLGWISVLISSFVGWPTVSTYIVFFLWPLIFINNDDL